MLSSDSVVFLLFVFQRTPVMEFNTLATLWMFFCCLSGESWAERQSAPPPDGHVAENAPSGERLLLRVPRLLTAPYDDIVQLVLSNSGWSSHQTAGSAGSGESSRLQSLFPL